MIRVSRQVRKAIDGQQMAEPVQPEDLAVFRDAAVWVLLGEPGSGKSEALRMEADATSGRYLPVDEFIGNEPDDSWRGKTLFLDGLDEVRGSVGGDDILQRIRKRLKRLGNPSFRITCRAADWYGSTDRNLLEGASPDGKVLVLFLEPLSSENILTLLRDNHDVPNPELFVSYAEKRGVESLLHNPQMLGLLAKAIRGDQWPATRDRDEVYKLACEKLAEEPNKKHRDRKRNNPIPLQRVLDAAGQASAALLLSGKAGFALDAERADERFPVFDDSSPPDSEAASQALGSKLFRPDGEERMVPSHRSIAEYLAARWMARRIDGEALPLGRVLNLLLGRDGRTVSGLRGLYGWLALHCLAARQRLIDADPLTVVLYGDVKPMSPTDKRGILAALRQEAERFAGFRWDTQATHPFGALADTALRNDFLNILQSSNRDEAIQSHVDCVLEILLHGDAQPELAPAVLRIVRDDTWWPRVRQTALDTWLKLTTDVQAALYLLDEVTGGQVIDQDDQLAGHLLRHLYPKHLSPDLLLGHLHKPKNTHLLGAYVWFWIHELPRCAPDEHLPILLDELVGREELTTHDPYERRINEMANELLARGVTAYGDQIADDRLFAWLGIGADKYGDIERGNKQRRIIASWLSERPETYKALLMLCYSQCGTHKHPAYCVHTQIRRLHNAIVPNDLGLWHLDQASKTVNDNLSKLHLSEAVYALINKRGGMDLSLDKLIAWSEAHQEQKQWLDELLVCTIDVSQVEMANHKQTRKKKHAEDKQARTAWITPHLRKIRDGSASTYVMHQVAGVWTNRFIDVHGETPAERFDSYSDNGLEVLEAAESGFRLCLERRDLPTVEEIIKSNINQKEHYIRLPCLIGMELRWQDDAKGTELLSEDILRRVIAFHLTYGDGKTPEWFTHLVKQRAELVAEVLIAYAGAALKAGQSFVSHIYALEHDLDYRAVAAIAAPRLLETFPLRARSGQLSRLEQLLKAALRYSPQELQLLVRNKVSTKGMDVGQKVYWNTVATLLDSRKYEPALWRYVGKSPTRTNHLSSFLGERAGTPSYDYDLSPQFIGKLIELLTPHSETEWLRGDGRVTDSMRRGEQLRALVTRLSTMATPDAEKELDRLLGLRTLNKLKPSLESARHQLKLRQRENEFQFLSLRDVVQVLANKAPTSVADLAALALDHLDDIATAIRQGNDDGFDAFWNVENKNPTSQRPEDRCRNALLTRLRQRFAKFGVDCQPEADYANNKRADLRLSYRSDFELPVEIKRDSRRDLWTALRKQLIEQYASAPGAYGFGIYLVLWFGGNNMPPPIDGGKKPRTAYDLRRRLEAQLDSSERQRIFVRVLDVAWPE